MHRLMHLLVAAVIVLVLVIGGVFLWAIEPTLGGGGLLELNTLVTAESTGQHSRVTPPEPPIQLTDPPELAQLALSYQPTLVTSAADRFWPVSVLDALNFRWKQRRTCLYMDDACRREPPQPGDLTGGSPRDYLGFPAPLNSVQDQFLSAARALGAPVDAILHWRQRVTQLNPFATAQFYVYYVKHPPRRAYPGLPQDLVGLQYWFFYPLNYLPTIKTPLQTLVDPIGATIGNTDYHQGDLEHVTVLLDRRSGRPRFLWMARHKDEGVAYAWHSKRMQWDGDHPVVYAAFGSHAVYPRCGIQRRERTFKFVNDYVVCIRGLNYGFTHQSTPLVDLSHTTWACWHGHLGRSGRRLNRGLMNLIPYEEAGPLSPLLQQENEGVAC